MARNADNKAFIFPGSHRDKTFPFVSRQKYPNKDLSPKKLRRGETNFLANFGAKKKLFYSRIRGGDAGSCVAVPPILMKIVPKNQIKSDAICGKASFVLGTEEGLLTRSWPQNVRRHSDTIRSGDRTKHHY